MALGLEKHIVGVSYLNSDLLPEVKGKIKDIPVLSKKYPSLETLLGHNVDFLYGRESAFKSSSGTVISSVSDLEQTGIKSYVSQGTYVMGATLDDLDKFR